MNYWFMEPSIWKVELLLFHSDTGNIYTTAFSKRLLPSSLRSHSSVQLFSFAATSLLRAGLPPCYLRSISRSRIEESFSMEPRIMFMGCNDKECRLLGLSPNPFQSYLVTVAGIHDAYVCVHVHVTRTVIDSASSSSSFWIQRCCALNATTTCE